MFQAEIKKIVSKVVEEKFGGALSIDFSVAVPENPEHGDYATNAALVLGKVLKKNPMEVAETIARELSNINYELWKAEAISPGFINFKLTPKVFSEELLKILQKGENYGNLHDWDRKKVVVEFTDPNPFKEFHIGHLYTNIIGETLCRIFEMRGAEVRRANYQGDVGLHVAKAVWGMRKKLQVTSYKLRDLEERPLRERIKFMGESYAEGNRSYEEDEKAKKEITELNKKIFALDPEIAELYQKGRKWSMDYFEEIYRRLGTKFDFYYLESEVGKEGLELVKEQLAKGIFEESEGAIVFPGEKYGLHRRVFVNSAGLPTYEAKELGLAPRKFKDFPYDLSVIVTGSEIVEYFKVLLAALGEIKPELAEKTKHISHGMVRMKDGKMSSRTGAAPKAEELLDEMKRQVFQITDFSKRDILEKEREEIAEQVAIGAVRYSFLKVGLPQDIIFDPDASLSLQGDSGPYLQYTYTRLQSVLNKGDSSKNPDFSILEKDSEHAVMRQLMYFQEAIIRAGEHFAPHIIAEYLYKLANAVNAFYEREPILKAESPELMNARIGLMRAAAIVLKSGLQILGIPTPEKM